MFAVWRGVSDPIYGLVYGKEYSIFTEIEDCFKVVNENDEFGLYPVSEFEISDSNRYVDQHICPICGKCVFENRISHDICDVCGWQDEVISDDDMTGANSMSVQEARRVYDAGLRQLVFYNKLYPKELDQKKGIYKIPMRVIVCGGRDFAERDLFDDSLKQILDGYEDVEIVSGHASGADHFGEDYAIQNNLRLKLFKPEWNKYGRAAGPIRNKQMLDYALEKIAVVIAFWDGKSKGTRDMILRAKEDRVIVHIIKYDSKENRIDS